MPGTYAGHGERFPWSGPLFRALRTCANIVMRPGRSQGREGDCRARRLTITRTMAVGMDAPALDGWTPTRIPGRGPPPTADTLADGRRGRPHRRTGSFVIRAPRPTRRDGRLQTTGGTRVPAMGSAAAAVRLGVRSRPSSRPSKVSILDGGPGGCPSGCPSGCPAVGSGASIPTACRAWKVQEDSMRGAGDRRGGAWPRPPDRGRLSAATSRSCSRPSRTHLQRVYHGRLGTFLHSGQREGALARGHSHSHLLHRRAQAPCAIRMPGCSGPYARAPARRRTRSGWVHMPSLSSDAFLCQHSVSTPPSRRHAQQDVASTRQRR
jgi:hypothetical protein